jgi:hypothetical protein
MPAAGPECRRRRVRLRPEDGGTEERPQGARARLQRVLGPGPGLTLDDLLEIAQLPEAQLDATDMAEGARECWGLAGRNLSRGWFQRPHLRFLAQLTPARVAR